MKSTLIMPAVSGVTLIASASLVADTVPQSQVTFIQASAESWNVGWDGVLHRIYTIQVSVDLVNWIYAPVFEFGIGLHEWEFGSTSDKAFLRLKYEDHPEVDTLEEAKSVSLDGTGMPGEWKLKNGLDPFDGTGINGPDGDKDGDGVPNKLDVRPDSPSAGVPTITITHPVNGTTVTN